MDAVDRLLALGAIGDVIGRYCMLFDDQDWVGLDELWTEDAAFVVDDASSSPSSFNGRAAVMDFLRTCLPTGYQSKHMISPPLIELGVDGTHAVARTDVIWLTGNFEVAIVARYNDTLRFEAGHWRFARRVETPMQHVPGPPPMSDAATGASAATMRPL